MIDKVTIEEIVKDFIKDTELFVVDLRVSSANLIRVFIDSMEGVDIDTCIELSRHIEAQFDREVEDFELEVSSAGISDPFKVHKQYIKNINRVVCIQLLNNEKITGTLTSVKENEIQLNYEEIQKVGPKGKKKKVAQEKAFPFSEIRQTTLVISLK